MVESNAHFLLCPLIFVLAQWALLLHPETSIALLPALWTVDVTAPDTTRPPLHPKTHSASFTLGYEAARFEACNSNTCRDTALAAAAAALGRDELAPDELRTARETLHTLDRAHGFFSFVNLMWLCAIAGIAATIGPVLYYALGAPIMKITCALRDYVWQPLHRLGVLEAVFYAVSLLFSAQGMRYPSVHSHAARMVSTTGAVLFLPCLAYSLWLHLKSTKGDPRVLTGVCSFLITLELVPQAIAHGSSVLGFFAVLAFYGGLGFHCGAFFGGYFVGFEDRRSLWICLFASAFLVTGFTTLRACRVDVRLLRPFSCGVVVLGNVCYFLALLILSFDWRPWRQSLPAKIVNACSLVVAAAAGSILGIRAMTATAVTFGVLFAMSLEAQVNFGGASVVVVFINFLALYAAAHTLSTHPGFVAGIFDDVYVS